MVGQLDDVHAQTTGKMSSILFFHIFKSFCFIYFIIFFQVKEIDRLFKKQNNKSRLIFFNYFSYHLDWVVCVWVRESEKEKKDKQKKVVCVIASVSVFEWNSELKLCKHGLASTFFNSPFSSYYFSFVFISVVLSPFFSWCGYQMVSTGPIYSPPLFVNSVRSTCLLGKFHKIVEIVNN